MTSQHWTNIDRPTYFTLSLPKHTSNVQKAFIAFWAFCPLWNSCKTFVLNPFKILLFQPFLRVILERDVSKCLAGRSSTNDYCVCKKTFFICSHNTLFMSEQWKMKKGPRPVMLCRHHGHICRSLSHHFSGWSMFSHQEPALRYGISLSITWC